MGMIAQEALAQLGFERIHMNPAWNGGYFRFIKDAIPGISITVTFGCVYCLQQNKEFIVWLTTGSGFYNETALTHITTVEQSQELWHALTGKVLEA